MTILIRDYIEGQCLPDENIDKSYTCDELHRAVYLSSDDITGAETYLLTNGDIAVLQSIDLEWVEPLNIRLLITKPVPPTEEYS
jgi:hypothetical protein